MEMLETVSNYEQEIKFITGFAGSGKSTKLSSLAKHDTMVLTPTHRAAEVLMRKGVQNVVTIHSALKLVPTLNKNFRKGQRMQKLQRLDGVDLSKIKDVFIDEFSMINQSILDLLLSVLPEQAKVTVFGDPFQLPPVDGEMIDPLIYTDDIEELTTQHRADAPEVVETFMRFMNYIKTGSGMDLKFNPAIKKGNLNDFNPDTDRALAYTNAEVININNKIAQVLALPKEFSIGTELSMNGIDCIYDKEVDFSDFGNTTIYPGCMSKGRLMIGDDLQIASQKITNEIEKYGTNLSPYNNAAVVIDGVHYNIYYDSDHYATAKRLKQEVESAQFAVIREHNLDKDVNITEWCRNNRGAKGVKDRGFAWSRYIAHSNLVFNLARPYATTVHKSQGSEFNTVYIAQADIKKAIRNGYYMTYARLMYVALSRAINKVVII